MRVALVHDYLKEYGGAERVLQTFHEMWPEAPIYTAFCIQDSAAGRAFSGCKIIESRLAPLIKYKNLHSPLRFLTSQHFCLVIVLTEKQLKIDYPDTAEEFIKQASAGAEDSRTIDLTKEGKHIPEDKRKKYDVCA